MQSPISPRMLCRHGIMTDGEVQKLQNSIAVLEKEVELIDRKVNRLLKHREAVKAAITARYTQFAPIRSLPSEILVEIFMWVVQHDGRHAMNVFRQVQLLHICRKWRTILLALPLFWSTSSFSIKRPYEAEGIAELGKWLARSQPGILDLSLSLGVDYYGRRSQVSKHSSRSTESPDPVQSMDMILDTVIPHLQRCTRISLSFSQQGISRLLSSPGNTFHRLRHLHLRPTKHSYREPLHIDFSNYPQLETLHISADCYWEIAFRGVCPSLREIYAAELGWDQTMNLLEHCPFITTCELVSTRSDITVTRDEAALRLPHLTELSVRMSEDLMGKLLDRLSLPALQALTLHLEVFAPPGFTSEDALQDWPHLTQLFQRCHPPLTELTLKGSFFRTFDEAILISSLSFVPTLVSLAIHWVFSPSDEFFHALTMAKGNANITRSDICPQLTELKITNCYRSKVSSAAVAKMILSRSNDRNGVLSSHKRLTALHLDCIAERTPKTALLRYPGFHQCIEAGLDIKV